MNFICGKGIAGTIIADVRLDADGDDSAVVGNLLLGDGNAVEVLKGLGCFAQAETQAYMQGQAQRHHRGVELAEPQGRDMLW